MSDYTRTTLSAALFLLGVGGVASMLAIAWYKLTTRNDEFEKDTVYFLIRLFMGLASLMVCILLIYRYM